MIFYSNTPENVYKHFSSNPNGITGKEAGKRLSADGKNELEERKKKGIIGKFFSAMTDKMIIILLISAGISFLASVFGDENSADPLIILAIVIFNAVLGVIQENRAEKALEALKSLSSPVAKVLREKNIITIKSAGIVKGDIVILEKGSFVPADIRLIETNELCIDESALTGESDGVIKNASAIHSEGTHMSDIKNMAWSGTAILSGKGKGIVVATGMNTFVGGIAKMLDKESDVKTPLQKRLAKISSVLGNAALGICAVIFIISLLRGLPAGEMFITSVSLAVAAIPEGLPAIVTIVLSIGVQSMAQQKAVVKRLPAVETLGCANIICSDKTGTLTQNKMTVIETTGLESELIKSFILCNDRQSPTEEALFTYASQRVADWEKEISSCPRISELPFDSNRKFMATLHYIDGKYITYLKGAPDVIFGMCSGNANAENKRKGMASRALRVMGFAKAVSVTKPADIAAQRFIFLGLCGIQDPPRTEVLDAVKKCKQAGIKPVMITGDHLDTALAIAKQVGIYTEGDDYCTESEIASLTDDELAKKVIKCTVFARTTPEYKLKIVDAYQKNNMVVAMTGDGVNDAPALKKADIGCAMGISGTEVAKEAADLILLDDNFSTIVSAVEQGRNIYANIKKAVHFLLSGNIGELLTVLMAILLRFPSPLSAVQLLWVNLVTDSLPAIALGLEKADRDVMCRPPIKKNEPLFSGAAALEIIAGGVMIGTLGLTAFLIGFHLRGYTVGSTMCFLVLSISQLFQSLNLHSRKSIFKSNIFTNPFLILSFVLCIVMELAVIFVPFLSSLFGVCMPSANEWLIIFGMSVTPIILTEIYKLFNKVHAKEVK